MPVLDALFTPTALKPKPPPDPAETEKKLEPELNTHFLNWKKNPSPENSGHLLRAVEPIMNEALRSYAGKSATSPTMRSKAKRMILSAMGSYDPSQSKIRTHLLSQLQGLRRVSTKEEQIISTPEQVLLDANHLRKAESELKDELGRDPSDMELADYTGLSRRRLGYIRKLKPSMAEGTLEAMRKSDEDGDPSQGVAVQSTPNQKAMQTWWDFVYHDLDPVDQIVMENSLGMHGHPVLSNQDIARKVNLTPGAISQRKAKIQGKLDSYHSLGLFE